MIQRKKVANSIIRGCLLVALFSLQSANALLETAGGELFIDVSASAAYKANIFSNNEEVDDIIYTFSPGFYFERRKGLIESQLSFKTSALRYSSFSEQDTENYNFGAQFDLMESEDYPLKAGIRIGYDISSTPNEEFGRIIRTRTTTISTLGEYDLTGKIDAGFGFDYTASNLEEGFADSFRYDIDTSALYRYSPKLTFSAGLRFTHHEVDALLNDPSPTGDSIAIYVGADGEYSPKLSGMVRVGLQRRLFDESTFSTEQAPYISAGLTWQYSDKLALTARLSHDFSATSSRLSLRKSTVALSAKYQYSKDLILNATLSYSKSKYTSASTENRNRDGEEIRLALGMQYPIHKYVNLNSSFSVAKKSSSDETFAHDDQGIDIGVSHRF